MANKVIKKTDLINRLSEDFKKSFSCSEEDFNVKADSISAIICVNESFQKPILNNSGNFNDFEEKLSLHFGLNAEANLSKNKKQIIIRIYYTIE